MSTAVAVAAADFRYRYSSDDDLRSFAEWLARRVSPSIVTGGAPSTGNPAGNDPYVFVVPLEGEFMRPAVTVELVDEGLAEPGSANKLTYWVTLSLVVSVYGVDRSRTLALADLAWNAVTGDTTPFRPQMWAFGLQAYDSQGVELGVARVARRMRLLQTSLSMSLMQTDDDGKWSRQISVRVQTPRRRLAASVPTVQQIGQVITGG